MSKREEDLLAEIERFNRERSAPPKKSRGAASTAGAVGRAGLRAAIDFPLSLVESGARLLAPAEEAVARVAKRYGPDGWFDGEGDSAREIEGIQRLRAANRRLLPSDGSTEDVIGEVIGSLATVGGAYRGLGKVAQRALTGPGVARAAAGAGRLAPVARTAKRLGETTGFVGSRAREALAGAPLTALMDAPTQEGSTAYGLGAILDDTKYGDDIGEALLEASETMPGRVAAGLATDIVGDVALSGALEGGGKLLRRGRQPRLAPPEVDDAVRAEEPEATVVDPEAPTVPEVDPEEDVARLFAANPRPRLQAPERQAELDMDRLFRGGRSLVADVEDPMRGGLEYEDMLREIDRTSRIADVGPGTTRLTPPGPREPLDLEAPVGLVPAAERAQPLVPDERGMVQSEPYGWADAVPEEARSSVLPETPAVDTPVNPLAPETRVEDVAPEAVDTPVSREDAPGDTNAPEVVAEVIPEEIVTPSGSPVAGEIRPALSPEMQKIQDAILNPPAERPQLFDTSDPAFVRGYEDVMGSYNPFDEGTPEWANWQGGKDARMDASARGVKGPWVEMSQEEMIAEDAARRARMSGGEADATPAVERVPDTGILVDPAAAESPAVKAPTEVPVGGQMEMGERIYIRTPRGFREVGKTGNPKGRTLTLADVQTRFQQASDPVYRQYREIAQGIADPSLLTERTMSLQRKAMELKATGSPGGASIAEKEARAYLDEMSTRGIPLPDNRELVAEMGEKAAKALQEANQKRPDTLAGTNLAAALGNEAGFASPGAVSALARVGTGAAIGAAADDEDPGRGALLGAALGAGAPAVLRAGMKAAGPVVNGINLSGIGGEVGGTVQAWLKRNGTSPGDLPYDVFLSKLRNNGWVESQVKGVDHTIRDFNRLAKDAYGGVRKMTDAEIDAVDKVLKGGSEELIPEVMRPVVKTMREQVDALSRKLIEEGVVQGPLAATIESGIGFYAKRSYRIFDDPKWKKQIPPDVFNRAVAYVRSEFPDTPEGMRMADNAIEELLLVADDTSPLSFMAGRKLGSKAMSTLTKRKDIHPSIRALWGEYGEAQINYAKSVANMAQLIGNHRILMDAKEAGLKGGWLFEPDTPRPDGFAHQIAAEGSKAMAPLNGLYTSKEIADAFEQSFDSAASGPFLRNYMKLNGAVKVSKVVFSPQAQVRNFVGNVGFAIANGHLRGDKMADAFRTVMNDLGAVEKVSDVGKKLTGKEIDFDYAKFRAKYRRLLELGVVSSGTVEGELRDLIKDATRHGLTHLSNPIVNAANRGVQLSMNAYRAGDDVWKSFAFSNEMTRYRKAYPDMPEPELEEKVAGIIRNTYPNYEMVPNAVKMLRRVPLIGTFVSFPAEVVRVGYNTLKQAQAEIRDPSKAVRDIGYQRAAGIAMAAGSTTLLTIGTRQLVGVTPEEEDDMRKFLPSWSKHSQFYHLGKDERGNYRFINMGYTDPYSYLKEPVMALLSNEDWETKLTDTAWMMLEPFFGEELLASRLVDVARNKKKDTGGQVFNEQLPLPDRIAEQMLYVAEAFEPGILTSGRRVKMGLTGETTESGRVYDAKDEITAVLSGMRREALDVRQSVRFRARDFQKGVTEANRILNSTLSNRGAVDDDDIRDAYEDTEAARQGLFEEMHDEAQAAIRMGMTRREVFEMMRQSGVSENMAKQVISGRYTPYQPSKQFLKSIRRSTALGAQDPQDRQARLEDLKARTQTTRQLYSERRLTLENER